MFTLHNGDCLQIMPTLQYDVIITDAPFDTGSASWDDDVAMKIEFYKAIIFCVQPLTSRLVLKHEKIFKYDLVWNKNFYKSNSFKTRPGRKHETILVFGDLPYNPQMIKRSNSEMKRLNKVQREKYPYKNPSSVLDFDVLNNRNSKRTGHPCEKPVDLMEWLILTYTNPNDVILDPFMGSGTTIEAAERTGRNSIGIEKDEGIFQTAVLRLKPFTPSNTACTGRLDSSANQMSFTAEGNPPAKARGAKRRQ